MNSEIHTARTLHDIELEVQDGGQAWMRLRLEEKLQAEADRHGAVFPLGGCKAWHRLRRSRCAFAPASAWSCCRCGTAKIPLTVAGAADLAAVRIDAAPAIQSGLRRQADLFRDDDRLLWGGGATGGQGGLPGGGLDDPGGANPRRLTDRLCDFRNDLVGPNVTTCFRYLQ